MEKTVRKRTTSQTTEECIEAKPHGKLSKQKEVDQQNLLCNTIGSYWLTKIVLLRYLSFIYGVAFLIAYQQNKALIGRDGLLPANQYLQKIDAHFKGDILQKLKFAPTIFWMFDYKNNIDVLLNVSALTGLSISVIILVQGAANMLLMTSLWILYHSISSVGQRWYSFGWESQLLESGFLAIFLCPLLSMKKFPERCSQAVIWAYRWLIFRIMIGAGLIKLRGDSCWRDLTCMNYHYQTQPVPNPASLYLHQTPELWHKMETAGNHFVELIAPLMLIIPLRKVQIVGGSIQILFQVILICSGNLSFLNWLTILPCIACFDDKSLSWLFTSDSLQKLSSKSTDNSKGSFINSRRCIDVLLTLLIGYLSIPVVKNLLSSGQAMNTSFDPLKIVNTYGAFGSITRERTEVIVQGTYTNPDDPSARWYEYEFKCKPGNVTKRPCLISPYHYRLDWLMWFAAFQNYQHNPWLIHFVAKLLANDQLAVELIDVNPFAGKSPPKYIRLEHYRYEYSTFNSKEYGKTWWTRRKMGSYMPPVSLHSLQPYLQQMGWSS